MMDMYDRIREKSDRLLVLALGDFDTKTGLGTALHYPLGKLVEKEVIDAIVLGIGHTGWSLLLEDKGEGIPVLNLIGEDYNKPPWGKDCLGFAIKSIKEILGKEIDLLWTCMDLPQTEYISHPEEAVMRFGMPPFQVPFLDPQTRFFRHLGYFPIDGLGLNDSFHPYLAKCLMGIDIPVCLCNWIKDAAKAHLNVDLNMIYHGVDSKIFTPTSKVEAMNRLGIVDKQTQKDRNIEDLFIVNMIATNQERKLFEDFIPIMHEFCRERKDVFFIVHTELNSQSPGSHDLAHLIHQYGLQSKMIDTSSLNGCPDTDMRDIYALSDVGVLLSIGEGFGLPPTHFRMMGIPCLVSDNSAMRELTADPFEIIKNRTEYYSNELNLVRTLPDRSDCLEKLEILYSNRGYLKVLGEKCQRDAMKRFDYDTVIIPQWEELIAWAKKDLAENPPPGRNPEILYAIAQEKMKALGIKSENRNV